MGDFNFLLAVPGTFKKIISRTNEKHSRKAEINVILSLNIPTNGGLMRIANDSYKEKFIIAAAKEFEEHGFTDFSIRRVSKLCELSCSAPYRHFKNKDELILETIRYINKKWNDVQKEAVAQCSPDLREQIITICVAYVKFLCDHPEYASLIFMNDRSLPPELIAAKAGVSAFSTELVDKYCASVTMPDDVRERKLFAIRSFMYGAAIIINSGEMVYCKSTVTMVKNCIEREFDIA